MTYTITILRQAQKELSDLPQESYVRARCHPGTGE
jgi:hypothetical protein